MMIRKETYRKPGAKVFLSLAAAVCICFSCTGAEQKEMKASQIIRLLAKGKQVHIHDAIITDDLDFTLGGTRMNLLAGALQREAASGIFFANCVFMGKVTAGGQQKSLPVHTCFRNNLIFTACDFRGTVNFNDAVVFGTVNFSKSVFREDASFNNMAIWAKDSYFSEVTAEKKFSAIYTSFAGNLHCIGAQFGDYASFQEMSVKGKLTFNYSAFKGKAGFELTETCGGAFFHHVRFEQDADFSFSRFLHTADFVNVTFGKKGNFEKAFFLNTARFDGTDMQKDLILRDTFFGNNTLNNNMP
ncbi:MAG: pentapeptide repeat-containing protein [Bacteroidales bacterium]|jgi:hypothetical protein|nr:pentapeptide repeat-containing protein [Bacteroidales bacterium]